MKHEVWTWIQLSEVDAWCVKGHIKALLLKIQAPALGDQLVMPHQGAGEHMKALPAGSSSVSECYFDFSDKKGLTYLWFVFTTQVCKKTHTTQRQQVQISGTCSDL